MAIASVVVCSCSATRSTAVTTTPNSVVTDGYSVITQDQNAYAISRVETRSEDIVAYTSIAEYLRGRVPGVSVGADGSIVIRGVTTINASTDPLIVLDGVEINDINIVNPNDVYSVDVLKDASSSIYGVRGANGVIIITTKGSHDAIVMSQQQEKEARQKAREERKKARQKKAAGGKSVEVTVTEGVSTD